MNDIRNIYSLDVPLDARLLLYLYRNGLFPMADNAYETDVNIIEPNTRGIIPIESYKASKSLLKLKKSGRFEIRNDTCFAEVIKECANRKDTWINNVIIDLYIELFEMGYAHSFEAFREGKLVGGLYGIAIGKAFFGESMFSKESNASKIAFDAMIIYLKKNEYMLLDTQFMTPHLQTLGCVEIDQDEYLELLKKAI